MNDRKKINPCLNAMPSSIFEAFGVNTISLRDSRLKTISKGDNTVLAVFSERYPS